MELFYQFLGWLGILSPMVLGAVGSIYGCQIAGQAAIGAMSEAEGGYGKFVAVSAMPSSQVIYGIVIMFSLNRGIHPETVVGLFLLGLISGLALMLSGIKQGVCCASAINAAKSKPEIFALSTGPAAIVEGFSVFTFVFTLIMIESLIGG